MTCSAQTTLRNVLVPRNEIVHPRDKPAGEAIFVGLEHIEPGTGRRVGSLPMRLEELTGRKARFHLGDIVYGYLRPYLNKVWFADFDGYCSVDQYVFEVTKGAAAEYVAAFMRSPMFLTSAPISETPGQLPRIRLNEILDVPVVLPTIDDQRRIATELSDQLAAVDEARSARNDSMTATQGLRVRILDDALGRQASAAWPSIPFGDLLARPLRTGVSGPESAEGHMLGLSIGAVRDGRLNLSPTKRVSVDPRTDRLVREGAFYIVRGNGRLSLVGRGGIAPRPMTPVVFPDLLIEAVPNLDLIDLEFLSLVWDSRAVRGDLEGRSRTATGIYKINLANLSEVLVPLPDIPAQQRIVATLHERLAGVDAISNKLESALVAIEALPAALLRQAFGNSAA